MNFISLTQGPDEQETRLLVNPSNITYIQARGPQYTMIGLVNERVAVKETPEQIMDLLNPMRVFAGKRDVGEAAEQDTRTKLLIDAFFWIPDSLDSLGLKQNIRMEVGEAAIEQYCAGGKGG
jgi:hypothetical protein